LTLFPKDSPFKVLIVGRNPQPWIEKAKALDVDNFLIFPGFQEDIRPFCSLFDVGFILSTRNESSSFASREMMAMGIPLISSFFSGLKDNVENHINGVFVEPGNAEDVYNAMNFFLKMPHSELQEYRKNARLKAEKAWDSKDQFQAIAKLYNDLLNKRRSTAQDASASIAAIAY
jgi:glycosyltransferase involved in cell wall biosynthesis